MTCWTLAISRICDTHTVGVTSYSVVVHSVAKRGRHRNGPRWRHLDPRGWRPVANFSNSMKFNSETGFRLLSSRYTGVEGIFFVIFTQIAWNHLLNTNFIRSIRYLSITLGGGARWRIFQTQWNSILRPDFGSFHRDTLGSRGFFLWFSLKSREIIY